MTLRVMHPYARSSRPEPPPNLLPKRAKKEKRKVATNLIIDEKCFDR